MIGSIPSFNEVFAVFNSTDFRLNLLKLITANETDNVLYRKACAKVSDKRDVNGIISGVDVTFDDTMQETRKVLDAFDDATIYAVTVVMYAGRDGDDDLPDCRGRYGKGQIEQEFREWWNWLDMEDERFAREAIESKWPLCRYLLAGMYMFRIDERW